MIELRPYQNDCFEEIRGHLLQGKKRVLLRVPTGGGKTVIASKMLENCFNKNMRAFFLVHRRELVKQSMNTLTQFGVNYGVVSSGFPEEYHARIQICSIGTLIRRLHKVPGPKLLIWDEAHHCASSTWTKIFNEFKDCFHILLTATPERLDGKGLKDYADVIVNGPEIEWLIKNNYLCDFKMYAPNSIDMLGVKKQMGDYSKKQAVELVDKPMITGSAISEYKKLCPGKRAVVFCITIEHSEHVVAEFNEAGIKAAHIDGNTPAMRRDFLIKEFERGNIQVISNVALFGEGFDLPALECLIMLRPTMSLSLYLQMCGRVLRTAPGKDQAIILDHVGNIERHGLPDDERQWSLEGRKKKQRSDSSSPPVKICERCFAAQPPRSKNCLYCGHEFKIKEREISEQDGELFEIDRKQLQKKRKQEQKECKSLEELIALGHSRGYQNPYKWAKVIWSYKQKYRRT